MQNLCEPWRLFSKLVPCLYMMAVLSTIAYGAVVRWQKSQQAQSYSKTYIHAKNDNAGTMASSPLLALKIRLDLLTLHIIIEKDAKNYILDLAHSG